MGVLPVTKEQLGKKTLAQMPINPLFITDFNRVRLEFVGHYQDVCENPASTTLWLDVGRSSGLDLTYQTLNVKNDLSHFPVPFLTRVITAPTPCRWSLRVPRMLGPTSICHCRLVVWFAFWLAWAELPESAL